MENKPKLVPLTVRVPEEFRMYLNEIAWRNRTSVAAYVTEMIKADMLKNPNWRDDLDALNTDRNGEG